MLAIKNKTMLNLGIFYIACIAGILPTYFVDDIKIFRPTRALGEISFYSYLNNLLSKNKKAPDTSISEPETAESASIKNKVATQTKKNIATTSPNQAQSAPFNNVIEGDQHLQNFFKALKNKGRDGKPVKVLHYGDSIIAGDGIASTVRLRLQKEFGNGGPGFYVAGMDPRWMRRGDVKVTRKGEWDIFTILFGGNQGRYGLGGIVATTLKAGEILINHPIANHQLGRQFEIYTQTPKTAQPLSLEINGQAVEFTQKITHSSFTQWVYSSPDPIIQIKIKVTELKFEIYGAVTEFSEGVTWETTAVVGVSSGSFKNLGPTQFEEQLIARAPDLVVLMIGGNELGHGGLYEANGKSYKDSYISALKKVRGNSKADCLIISPLDQAYMTEDGQITSKPTMSKAVQFQKEVSAEAGCAFWNSWRFMGGVNSYSKWLNQGLAWTDLMHYTEKGQQIIGNGLFEALISGYRNFEKSN